MSFKRLGDAPPFLWKWVRGHTSFSGAEDCGRRRNVPNQAGVGGGTSPMKRSGDAPPFQGDSSVGGGGTSPIYGQKAVRGKFHGRVYHIMSEIGSGGSGKVFLARCKDEVVALKISKDMIGLAREYRYLKEFSSEGFAPKPIDMDDAAGDGDSEHYICMEYVKGITLRQILKKGPMSLKKALDTGIKLGGILSKIHHKNLIYCDLKPENIILDETGGIKLVDLAGIMREGTGVREFTKSYDRGAWNMGPRIADRNYNMFSLACMIIEMLEPRKFAKTAHAPLLAAIRSKYPLELSDLICRALKGSMEYDVFYRNLVSLYTKVKDENPPRNQDTILNIVLACSILFFIFTVLLIAG